MHGDNGGAHLPPPSLWPIGFAIGIACILVGLVVSWPAVAVGAVITAVFAFLWIRDVMGRAPAGAAPEPEPAPAEPEPARFGRARFLEAATLGVGGAIGGLITVPVLGFAVLPSFIDQEEPEVDLGPLENFPEGAFVIATYMQEPSKGEVTRRTIFVRNNGVADGSPSFTIVSNRCVHLGCPVQPNGPVRDEEKQTFETVDIIPTDPTGFGCPCHGGQYDTEGNRTAGPPVRALDRHTFAVRDGHLILGPGYSVGEVDGTGAKARISKYALSTPGVHVDGPSAWLYPIATPK